MGEVCKLPVDKKLSRRLAWMLDVRRNPTCRRLLEVLQETPELEGGQYVQGWAVPSDNCKPFPHGWIELHDRIVDPFWYHGLLFYFPAMRFGKEDIARALQQGTGRQRTVRDGRVCDPFLSHKVEGAGLHSQKAAQAFAATLSEKVSWMQAKSVSLKSRHSQRNRAA